MGHVRIWERSHGKRRSSGTRAPTLTRGAPDVKRRRTTLLSVTALLAAALTAFPAGPAGAEEIEQVKNGTFDTTTAPWWTTSNVTAGLSDGGLCAEVPGGTANRWDAAVGQNDITLVKGESYRFAFKALGTPTGHVVRAIVGLSVSPVRHLLRGQPAAERVGRRLHVHVHRARRHGPGPGRLPARRQRRPLPVLHGRRVAGGRGAARGVRTRHRTARTGQPGRLSARGPEERHAGHRRHAGRCPGS